MTTAPLAPVFAFLTGPTAVGKSDVALILAERLSLELLSIDSRQIYRRLEIGTAKPTSEERSRVRHHLLDLLGPEEPASAGWFRERYLEARAEMGSRGARGLAVGGTGLYWEACTRGLHRLPASDPAVRAELEQLVERDGLGAAFTQLAALDPLGAAGLDRHNRHRVLRALELVRVTGRTLGEIYAGAREGESASVPRDGRTPDTPTLRGESPQDLLEPDPHSSAPSEEPGDPAWKRAEAPPVIVLSRPRPEIHARIESRCHSMLDAGLLDEIRGLLATGVSPEAPGLRTVGYREFLPHLIGDATLPDCVQHFVVSTRQYAKRQETWFRNRVGGKIDLEISSGESPESVADRVLTGLASSHAE